MHRAAHNRQLDRDLSPVVTGAWFIAALSRLLSMRSAGRPTRFFLVLTAVELAVAGLLALTDPHRPRRAGVPVAAGGVPHLTGRGQVWAAERQGGSG